MASYANTTTSGTLVSQGTQSITDLMNRFGDNESITGLGVGTLFDIGRSQVDTGLALQYNDAFLSSLGNYQQGLENLRFGNTSQLLAQEGAIARDLTDMTTGRQLEGLKYTADQSLAGTKYSADQGLAGIRYTADKGLEGTKYGFDSQERQIGLQGREDRLNKEQDTLEEKKLRADARGAIRSQGARFYG